ncbi:hypothetical protein HY463_00230 [Candidatus Peregrinibacteria bacterium]|nr:hypothetical protein [Candidatus Peregrinibacteria bacterium]
MALSCGHYGQNEPFKQHVIFLDAPKGVPEAAKSIDAKAEAFKKDVIEKKLREENQKAVSAVLDMLKVNGKVDEAKLKQLNDLVTKYDEIETAHEKGELDKEAYEASLRELNTIAFGENLEIPTVTLRAIAMIRKQASEKLALKESKSAGKTEREKLLESNKISDLDQYYSREGTTLKIDFKGNKKAEALVQIQDILKDPAHNKNLVLTKNKVDYTWDDTKNPPSFYSGEYRMRIATGNTITIRDKSTAAEVKKAEPKPVEKKDAHETVAEEKMSSRVMNFIQVAEDFKNNTKVQIPTELKDSKAWEYSEDMQYMNHGAEVKAALNALNKIAGAKTWVELWEKIRNRNLAKEDITMREISKTVLGESETEVYKKYNTLTVQNTILDLAEQGKKGGMSGAKLFNFIKSQLATDQEKITLNGMTEYLDGTKDPEELRKQLNDLMDFMSAASTLIKEIPNLKPMAEEKEYINTNLHPVAGLQEIETVASFIFPDKGDAGPEAARTWLQKLMKTGKHNLDMGTAYKRGQADTDLQLSSSGESAYVQLVASALEYDEQGYIQTNMDAFVRRLNHLRQIGIEHIGESQNKDLIAKWEQNKEFLSKPLEVKDIFPQNNVVELERDIIRHGLRKDLDVKKTLDRYETLFEDIEDPITRKTMQKVVMAGYVLDAQAFKDVSATIKQQLVAYAKAGLETSKTIDKRHYTDKPGTSVENNLSFDVGKVFDAGHGVKWGVGLHGNALSVTIIKPEAFISATQKIGKSAKLTEGVAATADTSGVKAGAAVGLEISLDEYGEHKAGFGAGAGLSTNPYENLFIAMGYSRDMEGTFARKKAEIGADPYINNILEEQTEDYREKIRGLPPELRNQLLAEAAKFVETNRGNEAIKDMPKFAITAMGLAYIPGTVLYVPYIKVAFKGKDQIIYNTPKSMDKDALTEKRVKEAVAAAAGNGEMKEIFIAGNMELTPDGYRTISEAALKKDKLTAMNDALIPQGMQIRGNATESGGHYKLWVSKAHGNVDIYADADSGIQIYPNSRGDVILNLDTTDTISVIRVDELNGLRDSGGVYNTKIYISNDANISRSDIEHRSPQILHFTSELTKGQKTRATLIENKAGKGAAFASEKATLEAGYELGDLYKNLEELNESGLAMSEALKSGKYGETLSSEKKSALDALAQKLLDDPKSKLDYKKLSVETDEKAIVELLKANLPAEQLPKSNLEKTYLRQTLMVKSLAKAPQDKAFVEHIRKWNAQALERQLTAKNMDKTMAHEIASKIMAFYAAELEKGLNPQSISEGSIVQIQVGTQGIEGYREMFYQGNDKPELIGVEKLTNPESLKKYGLTPEQAQAFIDAVTNRLSPLSEKPEELMRSQLGLSVLSAAELIFGAEKCKLLAEIVKNPIFTTDATHGAVYKEFRDLVFKLRQDGGAEINGLTLKVGTEKSMGFYDACRNFTLVMNEKLSIGIPETKAVGTQVRQYIEGQRAANYKEYGIAVSFKQNTMTKKPQAHKPPEKPDQPEEETPEVEVGKEAGIDLKPGQIKPSEIRGSEDEGHGNEVPV